MRILRGPSIAWWFQLPAMLGALVILASTALLRHQYDLTEHVAGHYCATCVAGHALDHPATGIVYMPQTPTGAAAEVPLATSGIIASTTLVYSARAPPIVSPR